jgi:hypothetical protein
MTEGDARRHVESFAIRPAMGDGVGHGLDLGRRRLRIRGCVENPG